MGLHLWRSMPGQNDHRSGLRLDKDPQGGEELGAIFAQPLDSPEDLDGAERRQDMSERLIYADRAFAITLLWVVFLVVFPLLQLLVTSCGVAGLSDPSFIAVITTTTASVFGFWLLVGNYLFEPKGKSKLKNSVNPN